MKPKSLDSSLKNLSNNFLNNQKQHLKTLVSHKNRFSDFTRSGGGIFFDFSRQLMDLEVLNTLVKFGLEKKVLNRFASMVDGDFTNKTENRQALHSLCRNTGDFKELKVELDRVKNEIKEFTDKIHSGEISGSNGKKFKNLCVVGIGGSNLGTEFVVSALKQEKKFLNPCFIATCDPFELIEFQKTHELDSTLFIIISKSYTTREVLVNEDFVLKAIEKADLDPKKHIVRVTSKTSKGNSHENNMKVFHMFDSIGGRYSVSSAVGGLPISLVYGFDVYERFLKGLKSMDDHVLNSRPEQNIPFLSALIDIWNSIYLDLPNLALIPYQILLKKLPCHVQQLYMESNGKRVNEDGDNINHPASMVIFGENGTKAQHSFFQLLHQGRIVPVEFIGVLTPPSNELPLFDGISAHDELWVNLISQADALACGRDTTENERFCPGNRPSSIITIEDISPENLGRLTSFYEARTILAGFLMEINPFDQFGVELGKNLAKGKRPVYSKAVKKGKIDSEVDDSDEIYLNMLIKRKIN